MDTATQFDADHDEDEGLEAEAEAAQEQLVEAMADEAEEEGEAEAEEAPAKVSPGIEQSVETGGAGPGKAAPVQISAETAKTKKAAFDKKEKKRLKDQTKRVKKRAKGKDWTLKQLTDLIAKKGAEKVFVELDQRQASQGIDVLKKANKLDALIGALPKGKLGKSCKEALGHLIMDGCVDIAAAKLLFEKRFAHVAQDVGKAWTMDVMQVLWRQLDLLPESDVTLNTAITTFDAIAGSGGFGPSWEAPDTINTIQLGVETTDFEHLEHTVRHEIAHGVHTQIPGPINDWLKNDMQFWFIDFDTFIADLGGYPAKYTPPSTGVETALNDGDKTWLKDLIENQWCGSGQWGSKSGNTITAWVAGDPDMAALWAACPEPLRNACDQSIAHWYTNYENFQEQNGKRYFLNHWYHRPFTIGPQAMAAIPTTNDNYTAMSEKEFFANCYAEYFENPEGAKDNKKWGGGLSSPIKDFFKTCIIQRDPYAKFKKSQKTAKDDAKGGGTPHK